MGKKKVLIIVFSIISISLIVILGNKLIYEDRETITNKTIAKRKQSSGIAMMLETSAGSGEYVEATDVKWPESGYVFNETLSKCENGGTLTWNTETNKVVMTSTLSDKCYVYFDVKKPTAVETITNLYTTDGENGLYKHDGVGTYGEYEAGDNSIRYTGANPNNYVCFGTDAETCPTDNLYRIIGVFDEKLKLIKYDYATTDMLGADGAKASTGSPKTSYYKGKLSIIQYYYWNNNTNNNTWSESNLNTINLNINFWNKLGVTWQVHIDDNDWKVGGNTWANIGTAKNSKVVYANEITSPASNTTYSAKIGLMYVSDFRYAADPIISNAWSNLASNSYNVVHTSNWISMGDYDCTISRVSDATTGAFYVNDTGFVNNYRVSPNSGGVRPSFYLKSTVKLSSGSGTQSDSYRIA